MTYRGRGTTTGNSQSMAFEKALFRAHPEFASGRLEAEPISPNYLLVRAIPDDEAAAPGGDPVFGAFLDFMEAQMKAQPNQIQPLSSTSLDRARALVGDVDVDPEEDLGDDPLL
ncbi:MAG: type II toxin-antitoxin system PrlF family antitoxin [Gemmatimonadota bacterium]